MEAPCGLSVFFEDESLQVGLEIFWGLVLPDLGRVPPGMRSTVSWRVVGYDCWWLVGGFFLEEGGALATERGLKLRSRGGLISI